MSDSGANIPEFSAAKRLVVVSAGLSTPSSTRLLADRLSTAVGERVEAETTVVELRDLARDVTGNLLTGFASPRLQEAIDALTGADGAILVTPIFTTSYSGLFKSFLDVLDPDALDGLPVLIAATGGTERHSLALDYAIRPVLAYLHAVVVPTGVYAASSDWGAAGAAGSITALSERIDRAAQELADLIRSSDRSTRVPDPFALPAGFSPAGGFAAQ